MASTDTERLQAKVDNFQTQASAIVYRLVDPDHTLDMETAAIEALQQLYEDYPTPVQSAIRNDILPRLPFELRTGWVKCPHCVRGMFSPDIDAVDDRGRPTAFEKEICTTCTGSGELLEDEAPDTPVPKMTREEIMVKFGVEVE